MWTILELDKSYVEFQYRLKPVPLQLKAISDFLFDSRLGGESRVHLVIEELSAEKAELAGLIASGLAVRFEYRPVVFSVSQTPQPRMDNVLIGEAKFVKGILGERSPEVKGSSLSLMHLPVREEGAARKGSSDPGHALIVVSGEKFEQVRDAARTLASLSFPYPGTPSMEVKEIRFPPTEESKGKTLVAPGEKYAFQTLGFETTTFRGMRPGSRSVEVRVPSHFLAKSNDFFWVSLHMAYGSGMRKDSVLNVFFNDNYISSIFLENPQGGIFRNYQIPVPAYQMKRGRNLLTFSPALTPLITGRCEYIQTENLLLTIFGDSSLRTPPMSQLGGPPPDGALLPGRLPLHPLAGRPGNGHLPGRKEYEHALGGPEPAGHFLPEGRVPRLRRPFYLGAAQGAEPGNPRGGAGRPDSPGSSESGAGQVQPGRVDLLSPAEEAGPGIQRTRIPGSGGS